MSKKTVQMIKAFKIWLSALYHYVMTKREVAKFKRSIVGFNRWADNCKHELRESDCPELIKVLGEMQEINYRRLTEMLKR